jgi:hypothetical protein
MRGRHRLKPTWLDAIWRMAVAGFVVWAYARLSLVPEPDYRFAQIVFTWVGWPFAGAVVASAALTVYEWLRVK